MLYKNPNRHLISIILCQFFLLVDRAIYGQFIPEPRIGHDAVLVDDKIYYIGGTENNDQSATGSKIFYLDNAAELSSTGSLSWVEPEIQGVKLPFTRWQTSNIGGPNNDLIFIVGGIQSVRNSILYQFDTKTNTLSVPPVQGKTPPRRKDTDSVSYQGKIYIFSGRLEVFNSDSSLFFDNFDILNTLTMNWEIGSQINAPLPRFMYTATLVNGIIYYIGGLYQDQQSATGRSFVSMSDIYQYDTAGSTWSLKNATAAGKMPGPRIAHAAAAFNGKICMLGGRYKNADMPKGTSPIEPIAVLDTNTLVWSIPELENINTPKIDDSIPVLSSPTATLLQNNFMVVAFGNITGLWEKNNYVYVLNLARSKFQWFRLTEKSTTPDPQTKPPFLNKMAITGLSVGIIVVCIVAIASSLLIYRRHKKTRKLPGVIETPGDDLFEMPQYPLQTYSGTIFPSKKRTNYNYI